MNFGLNLWNKAVCGIHGLVVIEGMNLSGHTWIINEMGFNKDKILNWDIENNVKTGNCLIPISESFQPWQTYFTHLLIIIHKTDIFTEYVYVVTEVIRVLLVVTSVKIDKMK